MDPVRFGRQTRALRRRRGWRQVDLAKAARVSRGRVSRVELGHADEMAVTALQAIARALGARLNVSMSWNGEALDRLLDADHAAIVEVVASTLRAIGWQVAVEVSFNIRDERGSIDVLAFHPATGVVLVVEVKSVVPDIQAMVFTLDRKSRLALLVARERGWSGRAVGRRSSSPMAAQLDVASRSIRRPSTRPFRRGRSKSSAISGHLIPRCGSPVSGFWQMPVE